VGDLGFGLLNPDCGGDGGIRVFTAGRLEDLAVPVAANEPLLVFLAGLNSGVFLASLTAFFSGVLAFASFEGLREADGADEVVGVLGTAFEDLGDVVLGECFGAVDVLAIEIGAGRDVTLLVAGLSPEALVALLPLEVFGSSFFAALISAGFANSRPRCGIASGTPICLSSSKAGVSAKADSGIASVTNVLSLLALNSAAMDSFLSAVSFGCSFSSILKLVLLRAMLGS
jgi:hypothetical protein